MRPKAIILFERLFLGSVVLSAVQLTLARNERGLPASTAAFELWLGVGMILLSVGLVLLASRSRSSIAKWVLVVLTVVGFVAALSGLSGPSDPLTILGLLAVGLQGGAVMQLFHEPARAWFARGDEATE